MMVVPDSYDPHITMVVPDRYNPHIITIVPDSYDPDTTLEIARSSHNPCIKPTKLPNSDDSH